MAYVQVPKDLARVKQKVLFNLTKRQLICFLLAGIIGVPFYFLTKGALGTTISAFLMVVIILPFFLFAMYEKDGRALEKVLYDMYRQKYEREGIRVYKTKNIYRMIEEIDRKDDGSGKNKDKKRK